MYRTELVTVAEYVQTETDRKGSKTTRPLHRYCDSEKLSLLIESKCNDYEKEGFLLISTTPIIRGFDEQHCNYTYGYSVTDGVILLFHK